MWFLMNRSRSQVPGPPPSALGPPDAPREPAAAERMTDAVEAHDRLELALRVSAHQHV
jgi:hypothetical protein